MQKKIIKLRAFFLDWENQLKSIKWIFLQTKVYIGPLLLLFLVDVTASLLGVESTVIGKHLIDGATSDGSLLGGILPMIVVSLAIILLYAVINYLSSLIHEKYAFTVRLRCFERVIHTKWQKISSFHSGDLVARLTSDVDSFAYGTATVLPDLLLLIVRLVTAFSVLYYYDHVLAITALLLGPMGAFISIAFSDKLKQYQIALKETESKYQALMQETIANISVVKSFELETESYRRLFAIREERLHIVKLRNRWNMLINFSMQLLFNAGYLTAFGWGVYRLSTGSITYGTMSVFLSLVTQIQGPVMGLAKLFPQFITVLASVSRIMEIEQQEQEVPLEPIVHGEQVGILMQDVSFAYQEEKVLSDVRLDIHPGDIIGLVGQSGAGKTTLIRLILSLITPSSPGQVLFYDSSGAKEVASSSSRRLLSYVPQGNSLSSGTILDNLTMGRANATDTAIWEALEIADAADFVRNLPQGLQTIIQERAGGLSEGQAQRIAIARALLKDAPLLILDEATSALDEKTETTILSRLSASKRLRTCIIITHRKTMLKYCTRAIEMVDTRVYAKDNVDNQFEI